MIKKLSGILVYYLKLIKYKLFAKNIYIGKTSRLRYNINLKTLNRDNRLGKIKIDKSCAIMNNSNIIANGGEIEIGEGANFNYNFILVSFEKVSIGKGCGFGPNVCIYDHDHNFNENGSQPGYKTSPVIIEEKCWIGAGCIILRGTHIGKNSVIGAGTIVKGDIPPNSLVTSDREMFIRPLEKR